MKAGSRNLFNYCQYLKHMETTSKKCNQLAQLQFAGFPTVFLSKNAVCH